MLFWFLIQCSAVCLELQHSQCTGAPASVINQENALQVCLLASIMCCAIFYSWLFWGAHYPVPTWRLILNYECLALAWLVSSQLFLNYPIYLLPLGFFPFLTSVILLSLLFCGWLCDWVAGFFLSCSFIFLSPVFSLYSLCMPAPPILSPVWLLAIQLFIRPMRCSQS